MTQMFPALEPATEAALKASIERFGVLCPVHVSLGPWQPGATIDGHHRVRIAREIGAHLPRVELSVKDGDHAAELQHTLNTDRRHLTAEQRREMAARLREDGHSLRAIGGALGVSDGQVRKDIAAEELRTGTQFTPERVRGLDGKERPSTRPEPDPEPEPGFTDVSMLDPGEAEAITDNLTQTNGRKPTTEQLDQAATEAAESKQAPEPPITKPDLGGGVSHPARYGDAVIAAFRELLAAYASASGNRVLDPFAGTGRIHLLQPHWDTTGVEIEPEWADLHPSTIDGSALKLPFENDSFDAIAVSPCYGNRLADHHNASDPESRRSYAHDLGRQLHPDNAGAMQWGGAYRTLHMKAWTEACRVLKPGGIFLLNVKDHVRDGERQHVAGWHVTELARRGLILLTHREIDTGSLRQGTNNQLRLAEQVYVLRSEE